MGAPRPSFHPKRTTKKLGPQRTFSGLPNPLQHISLPSLDAESVEVALTSEELAEQHRLCPARDHRISETLVLTGRAGNGYFRKVPSSTPPLCFFSSVLFWSTLGLTDQLPPRASQPSRWCEACRGACQPAART